MRAFLTAMVALGAITVAANWALERGPLSRVVNGTNETVRLGE